MQSIDSFSGKLVLPPDGRQTRIDFFKTHKHSEPGQHITYARKGSKEWWHTLTSWFKNEGPQQSRNLELFDRMLEEKEYSKKSRQSYLFMLRKFFEEFEDRDPAKITMGDIEDYNFEFFVSGRYSRPYQLQFINAIKLYYQYTFKIDLNLKNLRKTGLKRS